MSHNDFPYGSAGNAELLPLSLSILAQDEEVREHLRRDAELAGFHPAPSGELASVLEGGITLGDCVLVHCDEVSEKDCAALLALDLDLAAAARPTVVTVTIEALDDVFGCLDQSRPQILVAPNRAERLVALARLMARGPMNRLHETDEDDRQTLVRLSEQVARIAERLEQLGQGGLAEGSPFRFESPTDGFRREPEEEERKLIRPPRPPLPDPRLVRRIIRQRQLRAQVFGQDLFADPAWDILLDLTAARAEHTRVSVTSLCIASGVPPTTALRWIGQMVEAGLLERVEDETDRRRAFIKLSDKAADAMARYFAELGKDARSLV
jgi:DNA-binding MarR family transcriptional regulator